MFWGIWCCHIDHALLQSSSWYGFTKFLNQFLKQPSCPRNTYAEHWRKLSNLAAFLGIFLYLKNNDSVEHKQKVLLILPFIYFHGNIKFSHCVWSIWLFWIFIIICSTILLSQMKSLFFSLWKFTKFSMSFLKAQFSFSSNFASIFSAIKT